PAHAHPHSFPTRRSSDLRSKEFAGVLASLPVLGGSPEQVCHGRALVEEGPDVALRLGQRQRLFERCQRRGHVASGVVVERLQHGDRKSTRLNSSHLVISY